jgi:hypothetical protein
LWEFRFAPNSLFPNISLNDRLEIEFQFAYNMGIPFEFDNKEFFEFIWLFERLSDQRKKENEQTKRESSGMESIVGGLGG